MTVTEPLPVSGYGKGSWVDYSNYWRDNDTEWLQERSILRYADPSLRTTQYPSPKFGQITYNEQSINLGGGVWGDRPEMFSKQHNTWVPLLMLAYLKASQDNSSGVALSHSLSGNKGVIFGPSNVAFNAPIDVMTGVLTVDATGVTIKTNVATAAKLSTDATSLVIDKPVSAPSISLSGAFNGTSATLSGTLTVPNISMSGTLAGGVLNGVSGTIGGITLASNIVTVPVGTASANAAGVQAGQGFFYGDTNSAVMRQRTSAGVAAGTAYVQTTASVVNLSGTTVEFVGQPKVLSNRPMQFVTNAAISLQNAGPVIWSAVDPGVGNVPEGTIWAS